MTNKLKYLFKELAETANLPISKDEAIAKGVDKWLMIEYAQCYGGYRLVMVDNKSGAHYGAFGGNGCEPRLSNKEMCIKIESLIAGIKFITSK